MSANRSDWCQTYIGKEFYLLDPRVEDIDIIDISHALSLQCRYNGHIKKFFSVSQHSVLVSKAISAEADKEHLDIIQSRELPLWGLMHDAAEAYLGDVVRPLKRNLPEYERAEKVMMNAICKRFKMSSEEPHIVKRYDLILLATESRDLFLTPPPRIWESTRGIEPLIEKIEPWGPEKAEQEFLEMFKTLRETL